ncbi:hypothetical protein WN59_07185 [Salinicoccus sediminis]|uniref:Uncharacterized protein n=1 Tax=Salinicoccus sediminis TaxID=1432562 RepID=A0A0M2SPF9_9STAP|nr:hypothetical protein WN59_07185 [Salinicoccus sediminis]
MKLQIFPLPKHIMYGIIEDAKQHIWCLNLQQNTRYSVYHPDYMCIYKMKAKDLIERAFVYFILASMMEGGMA